jgi:hypothetical protein
MATDAALARILTALDQRAALAADIARAAPLIQAGLANYVDALATLFNTAAQKRRPR